MLAVAAVVVMVAWAWVAWSINNAYPEDEDDGTRQP